MIDMIILMAAFFLDLAVGDPRWLPHPVRIIGKSISVLEGIIRRHARAERVEKIGGVFLVVVIVMPVFLLTFAINKIVLLSIATGGIIAAAGIISAVVLTSTTIAVRDLIDSSKPSSMRSSPVRSMRQGVV